jgi:hypothetical protein
MTDKTTPTRPSLDDPALTIPVDHAGIFDPIPLARTERQREFLALKDGEMLINMGPQHPSTHGVLRVILKINGEQVTDLDPVLGYLHRGVEKLCENADYHQVISQVDPLEYISSLFNEWGAVLSFEKLLDLEVPRRAEYIRVLSGELNRVASHMLYMGWFALDLGGITPILWSFAERDEIMEMLAALTGQKLLFNYFRIGGVNGDLNHEFMSRLGDWMSRAGGQIEAGMGLLNENEIFVRRARGMGVIDREPAGVGRPLRPPQGSPVQRLPGAGLRYSDPQRGRFAGPLPAPDGRGAPEPANHRPVPPPDARRARLGPAAASPAAASRTCLRRGRGTARAVLHLRDQRRDGPALPDADPRPELPASPADGPADARQPDPGHDGDHGLARPGHGRSGQVRAARR